MQNVLFRLSDGTPGDRGSPAARPAQTPTRSSRELGFTADEVAELRRDGAGAECVVTRVTADLALRAGRPARPGREGAAARRRRRHPRPRGRRRSPSAQGRTRARLAAAALRAVAAAELAQVRVNARRHAVARGRRGLVAGPAGGTSACGCPKVESVEAVRQLAAAAADRPVHPLIESALGLERGVRHRDRDRRRRVDRARRGRPARGPRRGAATTGCCGLAAGSSPQRRGGPGPRRRWRSTPTSRDLDGLAASCRTGRALGFLGRTAIHPAQLDVIMRRSRRPTRGRPRP